ncbi:MAG: flagellar basal body P-ring formation protein FlgA [Betaproteobacteria bacterium]|nr:flagellar basal body P-ring formation protein FlgA [Betaproteobacteria bacterium]
MELKRTGLLTTMLVVVSLHAAELRQDPAQINNAAESFLKRETEGLPGQVTIEVGKIDTRVSLSACTRLQTFFPAGSRAWGQTTVGVRCAIPSAWTIYVPASVKVSASYLIAARPLALGQEIAAGDFSVQQGDLTQLPAGVLTDASQAMGRRLANSVRAGQPLRRDAVHEPPAIVQGQLVALIVNGRGFRISSEGHSLGKAPEGERVQVKTLTGAVVSGIVRPGPIVEVVK